MDFSVSIIWEQRDAILQGFLYTLVISALSAGLAVGLGLWVVVGKQTYPKGLQWLLKSYVQFFRNTPLLIQLYFFYKALPYLGITLPAIVCGILALSLQSGAYMAEIFRSGLEAVPREQYEGGYSLGFSKLQTIWLIILPQALRIVLPPLGNQVLSVIKNSSLVALITVPDLFFVVFNQGSTQFRYAEFFTVGVLGYMLLTLTTGALFQYFEARLLIQYPDTQAQGRLRYG